MIKVASSALERLVRVMCREMRDSKQRYQDDKDSLKRLAECMMEESIFATAPIAGPWVLTNWRVSESGDVWLEFDGTITFEKRRDGTITIVGGGDDTVISLDLIGLACEHAYRILPQWREAKEEIQRLYEADELHTLFDGEEGKTKKKRKKE